MKILITGGHLTPALATIEYIRQHHPADKVIFFGREFSQPALKQISQEKKSIELLEVPFVNFSAPKFGNTTLVERLLLPFTLGSAILKAWLLLGKYKPTIFLSFGGYLAVPVAFACKLRRIPIVTHEQTTVLGKANQAIASIANAVAVSFPGQYPISDKKIVVTGNPVRSSLLNSHVVMPSWLKLTPTQQLPLLYVTGGNQGSQTINGVVAQMLPELLKEWVVIHQVGNAHARQNYRKDLERTKSKLSKELQPRYYIKEWVNEAELTWIYHHATAAISRAGANTVQELGIAKLPAILIPLPFALQDEQLLNARLLADSGGALVIHQKDFSSAVAFSSLQKIKRYQRSMRQKLTTLSFTAEGAHKLYALVQEISNQLY
ncbi:MAG: glycosyltransferase [bacterium]|nr:glycosyltransferase [bacterium]